MSPSAKNYLIALLACTTVAAGAAALRQNRQIAELRAASTAPVVVTTRTTPERAYLDPVTTPAASDERPASSALTDLDAADLLGETTPEGPENRRGAGGTERAARMAALMDNPEFATAWRTQQRAGIETRYADLFRRLNLPPDQLEAFKNLLVERQNASAEVFTLARAEGLNPREARDQLRELTNELRAEVDNTIRQQIGETALNEFNSYNATQAQRTTVNQLNTRLNGLGSPLNDNQSQQLVRILSEQQTATGSNQISDQTIALARGLLTANQVTTLEQLQQEQLARQRVSDLMREQGLGGSGGGWQGRR